VIVLSSSRIDGSGADTAGRWRDLPTLKQSARRGLPETDAVIDALDQATRCRIAGAWSRRAEAELAAAGVFAHIARSLFVERVPEEILWLASRAICDELRHAEICRYVAAFYAPTEAVPTLPAKPRETRANPLVVAVANCAVSETIGSAFLSGGLDTADSPLVRAATRELLADEIDHARIGWALLGAYADLRRDVQRILPQLVLEVRDLWRERAREMPSGLPRGHGCLSGEDVERIVDDALRDLVLPGMAHVGIDPRDALSALA
jgi:hypothetical protein